MRRRKYGNKKPTINGITFDSMAEARYYRDLRLKKAAGYIKDFELQPRFELQPTFKKNGVTHRSIVYVPDFKIYMNDGSVRIVDVKGHETAEFKIKHKLFEYKYPELHLEVVHY